MEGQDGNDNEEVLYVDCAMYGKRAVVLNTYIGKGDPLFIEGRLKLDQWTTPDGLNRSKIRVIIENFEFMGGNDSQAISNKKSQDQQSEENQGQDDIPF